MTGNKTTKSTKTRHTFFIEDDIYKEMLEFAKSEDKVLSAVIRRAFRQFLDSQKNK